MNGAQRRRIARAKKLCHRAFRAMGMRPRDMAITSCERDPGRAITCYAAVLRSCGRPTR